MLQEGLSMLRSDGSTDVCDRCTKAVETTRQTSSLTVPAADDLQMKSSNNKERVNWVEALLVAMTDYEASPQTEVLWFFEEEYKV